MTIGSGRGGANGSITFNPDGSISYVGSGSTGPALWFNPATANIGTSYYIKFTLATGSPWVSGGLTSGTVYSLSSARSVGWVSPPRAGLSFSGTVTVQIYADAAGSSLLSTGTITENVVGN